MPKTRSDDMQQCIDECESCRSVCLSAVAHCLHQGGRHAEPSHITTPLDCVDMCATAANFMCAIRECIAAPPSSVPRSVTRVRRAARAFATMT